MKPSVVSADVSVKNALAPMTAKSVHVLGGISNANGPVL